MLLRSPIWGHTVLAFADTRFWRLRTYGFGVCGHTDSHVRGQGFTCTRTGIHMYADTRIRGSGACDFGFSEVRLVVPGHADSGSRGLRPDALAHAVLAHVARAQNLTENPRGEKMAQKCL